MMGSFMGLWNRAMAPLLAASTDVTTRTGAEADPWGLLLHHVLAAIIFAFIGIVVLALSMWLFVKFSPFCVRKEIEEDQNTALAIIMGSVLLGLSLIIAAAMLG